MKTFIALVFMFFLLGETHAQKEMSEANRPYEDFSLAYRSLNAEILTNTYTSDAVLLNLYDNRQPNSIVGANDIKQYFAGFFKRLEDADQTLTLTYKIIERRVNDGVVYDNGYYKLVRSGPDATVQISYGKLSTVLVRDEGRWKFKVDSNSNTAQKEYESAKAGSMPQPK